MLRISEKATAPWRFAVGRTDKMEMMGCYMKKLNWEEYQKLAREIAAEGCVLLKNGNHVLPLQKGRSVSVFWQDSVKLLQERDWIRWHGECVGNGRNCRRIAAKRGGSGQ